MSDPYTASQDILGRALNSFDLPDETVTRLETAVAYDSSLHSSCHGAELRRSTYRHCWLLADGDVVLLWELVHSVPGGDPEHEVYVTAEEVRIAASRLPGSSPESDWPEGYGGEGPAPDGWVELRATGPAETEREYFPDNSADHARRLLRRAENADRPRGELAERLLSETFAHSIVQGYDPPARFSLYEHGFLLTDGSEIVLWEVEHTSTPDGRHMCEVYACEEAAREAMRRRARVK